MGSHDLTVNVNHIYYTKNQKFGIGHYVRSNLVKSHLNIKSYFILNNELLYKKKI